MTLRKLLYLVGVAAILGVVYFGWLRREPIPINFPPQASGPWIAFGDSLTRGEGASEGNDYPAVLSRKLGVPILNYGLNGDTTPGGLQRLATVLEQRPRVVLLCLGGNDGLNQTSISTMIDNLGSIIDQLHATGTFVVLIGIRSASLRDRNEKHFASLARAKRVLYVPDMLRGLAFKPIYMSDAIHPNDAGYQEIAARLEKVLRPRLSELAPPAAAVP
jgi:acyl-CoA thioesterase-1